MRWENLQLEQFQRLGEGIEEALKMHGFHKTSFYVDAIREMVMEEITKEMNRSAIISKMEEFLEMTQKCFVDTKKFDNGIVRDIVAFVLCYTGTEL